MIKFKSYPEKELGYFSFYPNSSEEYHVQEAVYRGSGYDSDQLFYVERGCGILKVHDETYTLYPGDLFYLKRDIPHEYYAAEGEWVVSFLSFMGRGMEDIRAYYDVGDHCVCRGKQNGRFRQSLAVVADKLDKVHEVPVLCALTYTAVIDFFEDVCRKSYLPVEKVYQYLEKNYARPIALEDLQELFPYSKSKLCHDFKKHYGMTVFEALTQIRLQNARQLLRISPYLKLADIGRMCGYSDVSYFCKMYKKRYGETPGELKAED